MKTKRCSSCGEVRGFEDFGYAWKKTERWRSHCRDCRRSYQKGYAALNPFRIKVLNAKYRATRANVPFALTAEYLELIWVGVCPVFGVVLEEKGPFAAELDRIAPALGYVEGNVVFMSKRANSLKNNATLEELQALVRWWVGVQ